MGDVTNFAKATNNGQIRTPEETLKDALEHIGKHDAFKNGKKLLVLCVDDTDNNYKVNFVQGGMTMSQCLLLCEVAKQIFIKDLGY